MPSAQDELPRVVLIGAGAADLARELIECEVVAAAADPASPPPGSDGVLIALEAAGGLEAALELAAGHRAGAAPVLLLCGQALPSLAAHVEAGGVDGVVLLPPRPGELGLALELARSRQRLRSRAAALAAERDRAEAERDRVRERADGGERLARIGSWTLDFPGRALGASRTLQELVGSELTRLEEGLALLSEQDRRAVTEVIETAAAGDLDELSFEVKLTLPGGEVRDMLTRASLVRDEQGRPRLLHGVMIDLTEQRLAERRLRASERRLRGAQRIARMGTWEWEIRTGHLEWSDEIYAVLEQDPATFVPTYEAYQGLVHPDDRAMFLAAVSRAVETRKRYELEHRIVTPRGEVRWVHAEGEVFCDPAGDPVSMLGMYRDITELHRTQARAHDLAQIVETSLNEVYVFDAESFLFVEVNRAAQQNLGYTLDELRGLTPVDIKPEFDAARFRALVASLGTEGKVVLETVHRRKDGSHYDVEVHLQRTTFEGRPTCVATILDVTDRRVARERLARSEARLLDAQRIGQMGHWEWALPAGEFTWSDQVFQIFGYDPDRVAPSLERFLQAIHPGDRARVEEALAAAVAGADFDATHRVARPDGSTRWVHGQGVVYRDGAGEPVRFVGTLQDETTRVAAEERLRDSLREKEVLLKEVHHRVKNNLQVITALLKLQSRGVADPAAQALFATARDRIASMAAVHEELYGGDDMSRVEVGAYARRIAKGLVDSYRLDGVRLETEFGPFDLGVDQAVPCGLIVNELVSNALKHAFPGGRPGTVRLELAPLEDGRLELTVADDGCGAADPGALDGRRSLGLQLVHNLARQLQGAVAHSTSAAGTLFRVRFHKVD